MHRKSLTRIILSGLAVASLSLVAPAFFPNNLTLPVSLEFIVSAQDPETSPKYQKVNTPVVPVGTAFPRYGDLSDLVWQTGVITDDNGSYNNGFINGGVIETVGHSVGKTIFLKNGLNFSFGEEVYCTFNPLQGHDLRIFKSDFPGASFEHAWHPTPGALVNILGSTKNYLNQFVMILGSGRAVPYQREGYKGFIVKTDQDFQMLVSSMPAGIKGLSGSPIFTLDKYGRPVIYGVVSGSLSQRTGVNEGQYVFVAPYDDAFGKEVPFPAHATPSASSYYNLPYSVKPQEPSPQPVPTPPVP